MTDVIWTEPALQELDSIAEYIALDHPVAASHLIQEVFDKTERLGDCPQSGRIPFSPFCNVNVTGGLWR
ncbi:MULTISPECIES: type II toxin-antitoxin system RelE/ParE family toxin [unclassified Halomonas]|jgi:toxin ParE1/3/4|uniref:type II toxin-antitoxin system RelE/ParE family toxin n=1 Tax=unclassified Halomonas TaxID=2609666 RepID=UPI001EF6D30B|nr:MULTISPECIES: type II toxin-antitoxin system RelE/ParE family toxin [unclassified Halomonas]MCG7578524.1 type II toxin-antitoxin system RelE/ParE family toxin [Halomonas sp. MMH1-48]MCG7589393.1 type II toxin-antitoxin system RelE/ParE family toxin [Halomonas sp. McD50-5]MCG7605660.1 type II toxin-antitoxin system RelE/ParE family toxin [Halomonas sp. MM17-34]MCG7614840.1 type II toxin-antitoxin system RelE/ParE family toxin [Halomonas sp. MM17-29]MCG7615554.1 type II toxin-antitoxin system